MLKIPKNAYFVKKSEPHLDDHIFDIPEDQREAYWELRMFDMYGHFAHPERNRLQQFIIDHHGKALSSAIGGIITNKTTSVESWVARYLIAKGIVESTTPVFVGHELRRNAIVALEEPNAGLEAERGAYVAIEGIAVEQPTACMDFGRGCWGLLEGINAWDFVPAIGAAFGQFVGEAVVKGFFTKSYVPVKVGGLTGAVGITALAGAGVGGPMGAAAGAGIGLLTVAMAEAITALTWTGFGIVHGPDENWGFMETGYLPPQFTVKFGTYGPDDGLEWVTYWHESKGANTSCIMSAGQPKDKSFKVSIWNHYNKLLVDIEKVYYNDVVRVRYNKEFEKYEIIHCKSKLWGNDGGKTVAYNVSRNPLDKKSDNVANLKRQIHDCPDGPNRNRIGVTAREICKTIDNLVSKYEYPYYVHEYKNGNPVLATMAVGSIAGRVTAYAIKDKDKKILGKYGDKDFDGGYFCTSPHGCTYYKS